MVGEWLEQSTSVSIIIKEDGSLFNRNSSPIRGSIKRSITGGGNFSFGNETAECTYYIALMDDDALANWSLTHETVPGACIKNGNFRRVESPSQKADRLRHERDKAEAAERLRQERLRQAEIDRRNRERQRELDQLEHERVERQKEADRKRIEELDRVRREQARRDEELRREADRKEEEARRYKQVAGECDRLAAAPDDKDKPSDVPGVPWKEMRFHADEAVVACGNALKILTDHPRLVFQMARALQWSTHKNAGARALALYTKAVGWNYPGAHDNLGSMYRDGRHVTKDMEMAMRLFRKGASLGDPGSTYNVAYTLLKQGSMEEGITWLKKASEMGSDAATTLLAKYEAELETRREQQVQYQQQYQQPRQYQQPGRVDPGAQLMIEVLGGVLRGIR